MTQYGFKSAMDSLTANQPTGRIGKPSDFAGLVLFLSSYGGAHVTGDVYEIDGGSTRSGWRRKSKNAKL
jgi:NAD(P)-dependent dehydrogenase (short-subunit alcohol dehydrogenase family)